MKKTYRQLYYSKHRKEILSKNKLYRLKNKCKIQKQKKEYRKLNKEKIKKIQRAYYLNNKFSILLKNKIYRNKDRIKWNEYFKKYYKKHRKILINRAYEHQQKHKKQRKIYMQNYYKTHKKEIKSYLKKNEIKRKAKRKIYEYNKRNSDIHYRLSQNLRTRLRDILSGHTKSGHTLELLGCSVQFLKRHLQSQFKQGMTWSNWGTGHNGKGMKEWHIDHIRPCASFDLSKPEEQRKCFHYTNLQPLWATENMIKKDKII